MSELNTSGLNTSDLNKKKLAIEWRAPHGEITMISRPNKYSQVSKLKPLPFATAVSTLSLLTLSGNLSAQNNPDFILEEVVITAQKREQSLQDVPISVSAFENDFINGTNITDINKLVTFTPGLSGQTDGSPTLLTLSVRGLTTTDFGLGGDFSVGVYNNGIYQPRNGAQISLFDIDRIEVLKGPQGLLFGRNAASGAISIIPNKPTDEFGAEFNIGIAERDGRKVGGMVNLPATNDLAFRLAIDHEETEGHVDNIVTGNSMLGRDNDAVRLSGLFTGVDDLEVYVALDYEDREGSSGEVYRRPGTLFGGTFAQLNATYPGAGYDQFIPPNNVRQSIADEEGKDNMRHWGGVVEFKYQFSEAITLTSLTGFRTQSYDYLEDFDAVPIQASHFSNDSDSDYVSQEFRLSGESDTLSWFAGVSTYREDVSGTFTLQGDENNICLLIFGFDCATASGNTGDPAADGLLAAVVATPGTDMTDISTIDGENTGWAVFGEATYVVSDTIDVSLGLRYTVDEKDYRRNVLLANNPIAILAGNNGGYATDGPLNRTDDWNDISPRLAVNYFWSDDISLYVSVSEGYKSGGFDSFGLANVGPVPTIGGGPLVSDPNALNSYDPESVLSFELGIKSRWWNQRLQVNGSVYSYDYEDLQLTRRQGNAFVISNVGEADGAGAEFDVRLLPTAYLDLVLTASYSDTQISLSPDEEADNCSVSCDGNRLPYNPRWTRSAIVTYHTLVGSLGEFFLTTEYTFQDDVFSSLENQPQQLRGSYEIYNIRAGLESDRWKASIYVANATDKAFFNTNELSDTGAVSTGISLPRTAGMEFNFKY
jgi:iron complex outermembrane recepter protein